MSGYYLWAAVIAANLAALALSWRLTGPKRYVWPAVIVTVLLHIVLAVVDRTGQWLMWIIISAPVVFGVLFTVNVGVVLLHAALASRN